ncbi:MAG: heat-inducible transcription repressor HrcA, partial [Thermoleophilia bacterium]|nr:heat-inducible transcription repressor HrcA [Thermoleophilia bacterium]
IPVEGLKDCSIVSVGFTLGNRRLGRIGVIGPKRMNYARTVAVVELVGKAFSEALARAVGA